ncbi:MAG: hypothetical protein QGF72_05645 [Candidatus Poseidoniaceae archaeon]|jgi:hypothetical protein|nr:hypothetical protein [Candidatus Poseidoniaceae archaeon]
MESEAEKEETLVEDVSSLSVDPQSAHLAFAGDVDHLEEVRLNHQKNMFSAGLVPEAHLAEIAPERQLAWMVEELNGEVNESGFRLPLLGLAQNEVNVSTSSINGILTLKLDLGEHLQRISMLPRGVTKVSTQWNEGWLSVSFEHSANI